MAFLQLDYRSAALGQNVCVNIILPKKEVSVFKTLWLLHGHSGDHNDWMRFSAVERYARDLELAVVMPGTDSTWYTDTVYGKKYFTFITEELPALMAGYFKGYSAAREDNLIIGLSMGGYGALKAALTCPEKYHFCASLSGSVDITRKNNPYNLDEWRSIFGFGLQSADELEGTKHDLFALAKSQKNFPYIYMWCGTEDKLIEPNNRLHAHLNNLGIAHEYHTSEGNHSWKYWDMHIQNALSCWKNKYI